MPACVEDQLSEINRLKPVQELTAPNTQQILRARLHSTSPVNTLPPSTRIVNKLLITFGPGSFIYPK